jgi:transposase
MDQRFRTCDLHQVFLLPPSLNDWLPEDHLARFIGDLMDELDLSAIYAEYGRRDNRGRSADHPLLLTRLLLYGYCIGMTSSRRIEKATQEDIAFRYLAANQQPDHDTIANFRRQHLEALAKLFVQVLRLCQKAGLVKLGNVSIDGTKVMANASTHRSVPYQKLKEREKYWKETVERLLAEAQKTDEAEDRRYGVGKPADPLPPDLAQARRRLEAIRKAKEALEQEARQQLEALEKISPPQKRGRPHKTDPASPIADPQLRQRTKKQMQRARKRAGHPSRQYNFVDPDSRVMKDSARKSFVQAYNAQAAVDSHQQVIVAAELTQEVNDSHQLIPMAQAVEQAAGQKAETITADAGYWDTIAFRDPALQGIEMLVAPDRRPRSPDQPVPRGVADNEEGQQMRERLATEAGRVKYGMRKTTVEPVFGPIKEVRGIRRFRFRGLKRASAEWKLICLTHNLLKLFRHRTDNQPQPDPRETERTSSHSPSRIRHSCRRHAERQKLSRYTFSSRQTLRLTPFANIHPRFRADNDLCSRLRSWRPERQQGLHRRPTAL